MKHRLDIAEGYEFEAIGLSCHLRDFKLAWLINKHFKWDLVRETLSVKPSQKAEPHRHTSFRFKNEDNHLNFLLIANRGQEGLLIKKLSQFDYFLLAEGYIDMFDKSECMHQLRSIPEIQLTQSLESSFFEKIQYQIFET